MDGQTEESMPQWATVLLSQIKALNDTVNELQSHRTEDRATAPSTTPGPRPNTEEKPTKHLGPLAEYDGNPEQLEPWISQAQAKLHVDYVGCSEITRFYMLHNRLRGEASRQLQPWVQAIANTEHMTPQGLINQLRLSFGDPHTKEKAQRKLHKLKQANRTFMEYFTEYRKLVLEAGGTGWPDEIKKSYLEAGLSTELQKCMIGKNADGKSFEEYCNELKQTSDQLESFNLRNTGVRHNNRTWRPNTTATMGLTASKPTESHADEMDWEPSRSVRSNRVSSRTNGRRATWVSKETLDYRREKDLCLRCGNQGHNLKDCSFLPARRPITTNKASTNDRADIDLSLSLPDSEENRGNPGKA
ncbi:pol-like protein [Colletotrichum musicola]|uniref:Pol-like protein n=1 Tax=Colletotrichum musicola TaxID=2175873 RepID=A0A8H6IR88_9PEZI|nr:pol-like protein [Colletotrichum musicola]